MTTVAVALFVAVPLLMLLVSAARGAGTPGAGPRTPADRQDERSRTENAYRAQAARTGRT